MNAPGLYSIKPVFLRSLRKIEDALVARRVHPDILTVAAVVVSLAAGTCIALGGLLEQPLLWSTVPVFGLARLALNALDGSVARRTGTARPFGMALNELGDRASDTALIASCIAVSSPVLALGALASTYLTSSTGVLALALTGERDSDGPMGKADRVLVLSIAAAFAAATGDAGAFAVALWVVLAGALTTAALRVARLHRDVRS